MSALTMSKRLKGSSGSMGIPMSGEDFFKRGDIISIMLYEAGGGGGIPSGAIGDGYGGYIEDGFGGHVQDGT